VGESTIGFTFCTDRVVVANYEPYTVVFLNPGLNVLKVMETGSRNVGVKSYGGSVLFSLMDRDEIWVVDCTSFGKLKVFRNIGKMPFDALLSGDRYIVGFFKESAVGIVNLSTMGYKKIPFLQEGREVVFKIPHFGTWGIHGRTAYIPAVGERKIHVVDLESFVYIRSIDLPGLPVFVAVSPDGRYIAVNFSGDHENFLTLIERESSRILKTIELGRRILHFRFTPDSRFIYLSSYYENKVKKISVPDMEVLGELRVPTPSGVFIKG
jgi:protein NirF